MSQREDSSSKLAAGMQYMLLSLDSDDLAEETKKTKKSVSHNPHNTIMDSEEAKKPSISKNLKTVK